MAKRSQTDITSSKLQDLIIAKRKERDLLSMEIEVLDAAAEIVFRMVGLEK